MEMDKKRLIGIVLGLLAVGGAGWLYWNRNADPAALPWPVQASANWWDGTWVPHSGTVPSLHLKGSGGHMIARHDRGYLGRYAVSGGASGECFMFNIRHDSGVESGPYLLVPAKDDANLYLLARPIQQPGREVQLIPDNLDAAHQLVAKLRRQ